MKNKKIIILISASALLVVALIITTILLINNAQNGPTFNATVVNVLQTKKEILGSIIDWDSSTQDHEKQATSSNVKCSIVVNDSAYEYTSFEEGWIAANTTYKNKGDLVFTLYDDWTGDLLGVLGTDSTGTCFNAHGSILLNGWTNDFTLDLNGYKIDHNILMQSVEDGFVINVIDCKHVYFKNGCITGGANNDNGGGILFSGESRTYFENMTLTGNFSGASGGAIYFSDYTREIELHNTTIEGNYAVGYGGGIYCDNDASHLVVTIDLYDKIVIQNNTGKDNRNNLTFNAASGDTCSHINGVEITEDSCIYLSLSRMDSVSRAIVDSAGYDTKYDNCFHQDDNSWKLYSQLVSSSSTFGQPTTPRNVLILVKNSSC